MSGSQNSRSCFFKVPKEPTLATAKATIIPQLRMGCSLRYLKAENSISIMDRRLMKTNELEGCALGAAGCLA